MLRHHCVWVGIVCARHAPPLPPPCVKRQPGPDLDNTRPAKGCERSTKWHNHMDAESDVLLRTLVSKVQQACKHAGPAVAPGGVPSPLRPPPPRPGVFFFLSCLHIDYVVQIQMH